MKHLAKGLAPLGAAVCAFLWATGVYAEYQSPKTGSSRSSSQDSKFEDAVDLARFRKGNPDWDSQRLVVSGLTALHQEHQQILKELEEMKSAMRKLAERKQ